MRLHSAITCVFAAIALATHSFAGVPPVNSAEADFGQLNFYREANGKLLATRQKVDVVFLGDSITQLWGSHPETWFSEPGWINRGIGGQTTSQLLLREKKDALDLHPRAILLEGGSNDMRLGFTPEEIRDNFLSLGELAQAHHIAVFVATMTPTCDCFRPLSGLRTVERIHELNQLLAAMCKARHWHLIDINTPLAETQGKMIKDLTIDGVHPNDKGYRLLAPIIEKSLRSYR